MSIEKLLKEKGISFIPSGKDYLIKCLNPEHDDSNPSLRIDKISGVSHCLSCGWKHNIFKYFGVVTNTSSMRISKLKEKIEKIRTDMFGLSMPIGSTPYTKVFRGISVATLKIFEAFYTNDEEKLADRIVFPIRDITGKIGIFVGRHVLSNANPKYVMYPKGRSITSYPLKLEKGVSKIILVEGIFDMLNMYDKGIHNVVCVFGTQTFKKDLSSKLLPYKVQGIEKIYILFDGDAAGRKAAEELKPLIEDENIEVEIINLPDDLDPGVLDNEAIESIKEYIK